MDSRVSIGTAATGCMIVATQLCFVFFRWRHGAQFLLPVCKLTMYAVRAHSLLVVMSTQFSLVAKFVRVGENSKYKIYKCTYRKLETDLRVTELLLAFIVNFKLMMGVRVVKFIFKKFSRIIASYGCR